MVKRKSCFSCFVLSISNTFKSLLSICKISSVQYMEVESSKSPKWSKGIFLLRWYLAKLAIWELVLVEGDLKRVITILFGWEYFLQAFITDLSTYFDESNPIRTKPSKSSIHRTGNGPKLGFVGPLRHITNSVLCCLWLFRPSRWCWLPSEMLHSVSSHRNDRFCHRFSQVVLSPTEA